MKKFPLLLALIVSIAPSAALAKKPAPEPLGPPSQAVTNKVLDAIAEEMNRQMQDFVRFVQQEVSFRASHAHADASQGAIVPLRKPTIQPPRRK